MTETEIVKLMHLCRIECTEEEKAKLRYNLSRILLYVAQLEHIDTAGIPPCSHVHSETLPSWREDKAFEDDLLSPDLFFANAPSHTARMIKIPPIKL